jgi:hypothetical protein
MDEKTDTLTTVNTSDAEEEMAQLRLRARIAVERIGELNRDKDPDQVYMDVTAVVEEVRQEQYEAEQRAKAQSSR